MVKLKYPVNWRGTLLETGAIASFPPEFEAKLIAAGAAERVVPEAAKPEKPTDEKPTDEKTEKPAGEKPLNKMKKAELLKIATDLGITGLPEKATNFQIIKAIKDITAAKQNQGEDQKQDQDQDQGQDQKEDDADGIQEPDTI